MAKVKEEEMETKDVEEEARRRHEQKVRERWSTVTDCCCRRRQHGQNINEMEVDHPIHINHLDREEGQMEVSESFIVYIPSS